MLTAGLQSIYQPFLFYLSMVVVICFLLTGVFVNISGRASWRIQADYETGGSLR